jgi:hypothetical protein
MRIDDEEAEIVWEIDAFGRLSVEKIDETGSTKIWLGPVTDVLATLADFLKIAEGGSRQIRNGGQ